MRNYTHPPGYDKRSCGFHLERKENEFEFAQRIYSSTFDRRTRISIFSLDFFFLLQSRWRRTNSNEFRTKERTNDFDFVSVHKKRRTSLVALPSRNATGHSWNPRLVSYHVTGWRYARSQPVYGRYYVIGDQSIRMWSHRPPIRTYMHYTYGENWHVILEIQGCEIPSQ